jgi:hypothetical protein
MATEHSSRFRIERIGSDDRSELITSQTDWAGEIAKALPGGPEWAFAALQDTRALETSPLR